MDYILAELILRHEDLLGLDLVNFANTNTIINSAFKNLLSTNYWIHGTQINSIKYSITKTHYYYGMILFADYCYFNRISYRTSNTNIISGRLYYNNIDHTPLKILSFERKITEINPFIGIITVDGVLCKKIHLPVIDNVLVMLSPNLQKKYYNNRSVYNNLYAVSNNPRWVLLDQHDQNRMTTTATWMLVRDNDNETLPLFINDLFDPQNEYNNIIEIIKID
jgi:hypothetical protein